MCVCVCVCVYVCAHAYMCISIIPNIWNHGRLHQQVTVNSVSDCSVLEPHCGNDRKFLRSVGKSVMSMCMRVCEYYKCISFIDCSEFTHFIFQSLLHSTFCSIQRNLTMSACPSESHKISNKPPSTVFLKVWILNGICKQAFVTM